MNGRTMRRQLLDIELTAQEGVSLDDVLAAWPDEPEGDAARSRFGGVSRPGIGEGPQTPPIPATPGVVVGTVTAMDESGRPLVALGTAAGSAGCPDPRRSPTAARSTVALGQNDVGREVVVMFEGGDAAKPIVVGLIQPPTSAQSAAAPERPSTLSAVEAKLDGEQIVLSAEREIVLRCGQASITLTRAGKVLIRGAYLLSRSSGVNRIKGGSVQIN